MAIGTEEAVRHAMAPTAAEIATQRYASHNEIGRECLEGKGRAALDVGCGEGRFTRTLAGWFETVAGIDPHPGRLGKAVEAAKAAGLAIDFRSGTAESLPWPDASFDAVIFSNSLHHVADFAGALAEAARVLRPGGLVYVQEPVPAGPHYEAVRLVNDETDIRTEAYRALLGAKARGLVLDREIMYRSRNAFPDFEVWKAAQIDMSPKRGPLIAEHGDEVRRRIEANGQRENGKLMFDHLFRVDVLKKVGS
jgi:ubiquinone/menaquinone biosynthesis C-methylase UbiE